MQIVGQISCRCLLWKQNQMDANLCTYRTSSRRQVPARSLIIMAVSHLRLCQTSIGEAPTVPMLEDRALLRVAQGESEDKHKESSEQEGHPTHPPITQKYPYFEIYLVPWAVPFKI